MQWLRQKDTLAISIFHLTFSRDINCKITICNFGAVNKNFSKLLNYFLFNRLKKRTVFLSIIDEMGY